MSISIYKNALDTVGSTIELSEALDKIKSGFWQDEVLTVRNLYDDKNAYSEAKKKLPAITWSGSFEVRKADKLQQQSHIICLDIDNVPETNELKERLCGDPYVYTAFISPGGNGLKLLVRLEPLPPEEHRKQFLALENYFKLIYNIKLDASGKDINRLCFVSFDVNLFRNEQSKQFSFHYFHFERCMEFTNRIKTYVEGQRNDYVFVLANNCNRVGIPQEWAINYITAHFNDLDQKEIATVVHSAYKALKEHGMYPIVKLDLENKQREVAASREEENTPLKYQYEKGDFWKVTTYYDRKTGKEKEEIALVHLDFLDFLFRNGFGLYRTSNNEQDYEFVRIVDNVVYPVQILSIKKFTQDYAEREIKYKRVQSMLVKGSKTYFSKDLLEALPFLKLIFLRDTEDRAHIYFKNCFVQITPDKIVSKPYSELEGHIWNSQKLEREFNLPEVTSEDDITCQFSLFLALASVGEKVNNKDTEEKVKTEYGAKMLSLMSTVGYLLHGYKNPAIAKAVVAVDAKISSASEAHGGSGKSIFSKAIGMMVRVHRIDAQNFKFDGSFPYDGLAQSHRIIDFNDAGERFDFTKAFSIITEDMLVARKYLGAMLLAYEDSPKVYVSTNYTLKGDGGSHARRQHIIEFGDFFNPNNTVKDYFKTTFFSKDWDRNEFELFHKFMLLCIQTYLNEGLVPYPVCNYAERKLLASMPLEFIDYFDEVILQRCTYNPGERNNDNPLETLYNEYKEANKNSDIKQASFTKWISKISDHRKLILNPHTSGERDRRGNKTYLTFWS